MAVEAALRYQIGNPIDFTVANGMAFEKGLILGLLDPMTASGASAAGVACAGIAAVEKVAGDGSTKLSVWRSGIFDIYVSGAITIGAPLMIDAATTISSNYLRAASGADTASGAIIVGHALETGSAGEQILVQLTLAGGS